MRTVCSDHRLVRCKVAFTFTFTFQEERSPDEEAVSAQTSWPRVKNNLHAILEERHHCVTAAEPEQQWKQMKTILQKITAEVVGLSTSELQEWFEEADKEIQALLEKKRS